ncbi:MAG TPA: leishmanolysin-related zinc metalloendopeptidase [Rubellimicrobium sp.]|nr:leishmanolysin-related zinc metalloendopeptidase [Rubellimicrobium sp.]
MTTYTSGKGGLGVHSDFNITISFEGTWTQSLQSRFVLAAEYLSALIQGDVPDQGSVDDIVISATLADIDGVGNVLGQAGPMSWRSGSFVPSQGQMEFDTADAAEFDSLGLFDDIVIHEMLHTLGFGTVWSMMGLTAGQVSSGTSTFVGANATLAFQKLFPTLASSHPGGIPIETDGGPGTAGGHWDDDTFGNELMTGYVDGKNYISAMTVAALEDMGYNTVFDQSNPTASLPQPGDLPLTSPPEATPSSGNNVYVVDSLDDPVVEAPSGGFDTVEASISYTLGANVEKLILVGEADLSGTGNDLANYIWGNTGSNVLRGGAGQDGLDGWDGDDRLMGGSDGDTLLGGKGHDKLVGGGGSDAFAFLNRSEGGDTIADFKNKSGNDDRFVIDRSGFRGGLDDGKLSRDQFQAGSGHHAEDADIRFMFDTDDNTLWFDKNGQKAGGLTLVADLQASAVLDHSDIFLL